MLLYQREIACEGEELTLSSCPGYEIGAHSCFDPNGVFIRCPGL